jgi:hypothetical protein
VTLGNNNCNHFAWDRLIPHLVHPLRVTIIEAMSWIGEPVSPRDLDRLLAEEYGLALVAYHVRVLADFGAVEKVRQQAVRGALQSFYVLPTREPADAPLSCE